MIPAPQTGNAYSFEGAAVYGPPLIVAPSAFSFIVSEATSRGAQSLRSHITSTSLSRYRPGTSAVLPQSTVPTSGVFYDNIATGCFTIGVANTC